MQCRMIVMIPGANFDTEFFSFTVASVAISVLLTHCLDECCKIRESMDLIINYSFVFV